MLSLSFPSPPLVYTHTHIYSLRESISLPPSAYPPPFLALCLDVMQTLSPPPIGGELFALLEREGVFLEDSARFVCLRKGVGLSDSMIMFNIPWCTYL